MPKAAALSYYPLARAYLDRLEALLGHPVENLVVSSIRARGALDIARQLRELRYDIIYLPIPSADWTLQLPLLRILATLPQCRQVVLIDDRFTLRRQGLLPTLWAAASMSVRALATLLVTMPHIRRVERLQAAPRIAATLDPRRSEVAYLKSNLWAGVVAGGSVSHTLGVIKGLAARGRQVFYVSTSEAPELAATPDVALHRVTLPFGFVYPRELNTIRYERTLGRWVKSLPATRFAFIYHRLSLGSTVAVELSRRLGVPLVLEYNGSEVWISRNWGTRLKLAALAQTAEDACLRHAHLVITVSTPLRQQLIARGVDPERIVTCPNGVDPQQFNPERFGADECAALRRQLGIPVDAVLATFVGTFGLWHGAEVLAAALCHLHDSDPTWIERSRLHVLFVGDGVNRPQVEAQLAELLPERWITFSGLISPQATPAYLGASDLFLAPHIPNPDGTEFFGSPTKLFEYMAFGRPTVASALGQIATVLDGSPDVAALRPGMDAGPEAAGILVEPGNAVDLAEGIRFAVDNPAWRELAGRNARAHAVERHTWTQHVDAILSGLEQAVPRATAAEPAPVTVLINAVHAKSGGGLTYLSNMLPPLVRRGDLRLHVVVQADQEARFRDIVGTVPLHVLPTVSRVRTVLIQEQVDVPRLARSLGAGVIFSPANYGPLFGARTVILLRNAFEVGSLERRLDKRLYWLAVRLLSRLSFQRCRRAITVSRHAGDNFLKAFDLTADPRLTVIHHGVGTVFKPPAADQARVPGLIAAVSDIYVQKNIETLLEALALLTPRFPDIRLEIAGKALDPAYFQQLEALCGSLGIDGRVTFLGSLPAAEVAAVYSRAEVFVFPSLVETFGNPLLEAMASGTPVVCSRAAAMPEVAGGAALLAAPGDAADMAAQITRLLDDRGLWRRTSALGLARAGQFSWERTADSTARILRAAASE